MQGVWLKEADYFTHIAGDEIQGDYPVGKMVGR
jgi:hypothetical protein